MVVGEFAKLRGSACAENVWKFDVVYLLFVIFAAETGEGIISVYSQLATF